MASSEESSYHSGGPPGGGDPGRDGGLADVLQDGPYVHRLGDEGDDPHLGPALRAGEGKCLVDARQQHDPKVASRGMPDGLRRIVRRGLDGVFGCRLSRYRGWR